MCNTFIFPVRHLAMLACTCLSLLMSGCYQSDSQKIGGESSLLVSPGYAEMCEGEVDRKCQPVKLERIDKSNFRLINGVSSSETIFSAADLSKDVALVEKRKSESLYEYAILMRQENMKFMVYPIACPQPDEIRAAIESIGIPRTGKGVLGCNISHFTKQQTLAYFSALVSQRGWMTTSANALGGNPLSYDMRDSRMKQAAFIESIKEAKALQAKWKKEAEEKKSQESDRKLRQELDEIDRNAAEKRRKRESWYRCEKNYREKALFYCGTEWQDYLSTL